jgi:hypothetical protein
VVREFHNASAEPLPAKQAPDVAREVFRIDDRLAKLDDLPGADFSTVAE